MYARRVGDRELTFDLGEGLLHDNLLMVDRETHSVWSQLEGRAIAGPLQGAALEPIPAFQTTWEFWRALYPETRVMVVPDREGFGWHWPDGKPAGVPHDSTGLGLGFTSGESAIFFALEELAKSPGVFQVTVAGETVEVHFSERGSTAWVTDLQRRLLPSVLSYRGAWLDFHPNSIIYRADE